VPVAVAVSILPEEAMQLLAISSNTVRNNAMDALFVVDFVGGGGGRNDILRVIGVCKLLSENQQLSTNQFSVYGKQYNEWMDIMEWNGME
jgi:hypothetical protein